MRLVCEEPTGYEAYVRSLSAAERTGLARARVALFKNVGLGFANLVDLCLDVEAVPGVIEADLATEIALRLRRLCRGAEHAVDGTAGVGGSAFALARHFPRVTCVELEPRRSQFLRHNLRHLCGCIRDFPGVRCPDVYCGDVREFAGPADLLFLDPPAAMQLGGEDVGVLCARVFAARYHYIALRVSEGFDFTSFTAQTAGVLREMSRDSVFGPGGGEAAFRLLLLRREDAV